MKILLLLFVLAGFVAGTTRFESIRVNARVILRCKSPRVPTARVFLMESDFSNYPFDEDDTFDFGIYNFGEVPEKVLYLTGEEFEISGLEPYIYVSHSCTSESNTMKSFAVRLMSSMYLSRVFTVTIDLDEETADVVSRTLYH
ncbi:CBN-TTR-42 protein [Caenorhabditis brenneri]|uniref:CBN-TTR-42 protein n=1 Tax=Caenorhabditis brenneri TaxID=135651 RepID=G0M735_CAEBE|nr:CBN-TTR-42 protein [Caenorhabditis brenneri]